MAHPDPFRWLDWTREVAALAFAVGSGLVLWQRKRSSRYWPTAFGRVESVSSFENGSGWETDIAYSYNVDGEFYSGEFQLISSSERKAYEKEFNNRERKIMVRYSPRNKGISVVRMEDQAGLYAGEFKGH